MSQNEIIKVTTKQVERHFLQYGLTLAVYGLMIILSQQVIGTMSEAIQQYLLNYSAYLKIETIELTIKSIIYTLGAIIPFVIFSKINHMNKKEYTRSNDLTWIDLLKYTCLFLGVNLFATFAFSMIATLFGQEMSLMMPIGIEVTDAYITNPIFLFLVIILVPVCEEYVFRGVSLRFLGRYGNRFAVVAVSVIFGLAHDNLLDAFPAIIFSYYLCLVTLRYKSIYPAIFIHICNNVLFVVVSLLISQYYIPVLCLIIAIYVVAGYTLMKNYKTRIVIRQENNTAYLLKLFFTNVGVIMAIFVFLCSSVILHFL